MDSEGRKVIVCDNGTGVSIPLFSLISYQKREIQAQSGY